MFRVAALLSRRLGLPILAALDDLISTSRIVKAATEVFNQTLVSFPEGETHPQDSVCPGRGVSASGAAPVAGTPDAPAG